jgi:NADH:ubiquinone oxidoreductase subunit 5 (subunit L)/multisubunit Na+/H+ antiporter MnhA subunit
VPLTLNNKVRIANPIATSQNLYTWMQIGGLNISVGFLVDNLTAVMLVVVSFVSLMVHIYTIGYMSHDKVKVKVPLLNKFFP